MSSYAVVIGYQFDNEEYKSLILDTVDDNVINSPARITEQPLVSGDVISDHIFNLPKTMSISGMISLNDSNVTVVEGKGSKLINFEEWCENIQKNGIRCDIVKLNISDDKDIRFMHRHNLVLESFSIKEKINSISYNLSFKEILTTEIVTYDVDIDDNYLPAITEPNTLSFTSTLIDWQEVDATIIRALYDNDLIEKEFLTLLSSYTEDTLRAFVSATIAGVLVGVMILLGSNPVGWVLAAVGLVIGAVVTFCKGVFNFIKGLFGTANKYKTLRFVASNNDKANEAEIKRFGEFINNMHAQIQSLDTAISVYRVSENIPQEAMISIDDNYYIFTFTFNNVDQVWSLTVDDVSSISIASMTNISSAPVSFDQLTNQNYIFKTQNNNTVYILYSPVEETLDASNAANLTNYLILTSKIDIEQYQNVLLDIIKNGIINS